jgi:hypothetical protein
MRISCIFAVLLSVVFTPPAMGVLPQTISGSTVSGATPVRFLHRSSQGVEFELTAEGLSAIRVGGRTLASGGWNVFNAEPWFKDAQLVSRLYQVEGQMPKDFESVDEFFCRQRITPLLPVSDFRRVQGLEAAQGLHLDAQGKWKNLSGHGP